MINLSQLLAHLAPIHVAGTVEYEITGIAYDSRAVVPGGLFVAIKGYHTDGHQYISQALDRGATALVVEDWEAAAPFQTYAHSPTIIHVPNGRVALAPLAAAFYGFPSHQMGMVGITGTKGKSSTTELVSRVLEGGGHVTGMISTIDFKIGTRQWANTTRQSTPESLEIQSLLREMVDAGCTYAVVEATSHGLSAQWQRLGQCAVDVALFLNISHEHLDYHGDFENYCTDKARLFELLSCDECPTHPYKTKKYALANADDPRHQQMLAAAPNTAHRLTYGIREAADVRAYEVVATPSGSTCQVVTPWGKTTLRLQLPGLFNVYNALGSLTVGLTQGIPIEVGAAALESVRGIRGRMEPIAMGQPFDVIVDYAHNPDSFEHVMGMMRPLVRGRLIAVFGSAGERDRAKRPLQGAIAARWCDLLILTDEDPRAEDREAILCDIADGARQHGKTIGRDCLLIPDRREAIYAAIEQASPGDVVLLLGKGHEGSIEYADGKQPWDEIAAARDALAEHGYHK